jgi:hypothetical protein
MGIASDEAREVERAEALLWRKCISREFNFSHSKKSSYVWK